MGRVLGIVNRVIASHLIKKAGFSLHAGVAAKARQRQKLERLCRDISRPAVSEKRLSLTPNGNIRYQLKTPYRDGTTHVICEPLDFIARLAALSGATTGGFVRLNEVTTRPTRAALTLMGAAGQRSA